MKRWAATSAGQPFFLKNMTEMIVRSQINENRIVRLAEVTEKKRRCAPVLVFLDETSPRIGRVIPAKLKRTSISQLDMSINTIPELMSMKAIVMRLIFNGTVCVKAKLRRAIRCSS